MTTTGRDAGTGGAGGTVTVTVRYFAAARAAAGVESEQLQLPAPTTLDDLVLELVQRHGSALEKVLARCSYLLDEVAVRDREVELPRGCAIDVLPPFAGG